MRTSKTLITLIFTLFFLQVVGAEGLQRGRFLHHFDNPNSWNINTADHNDYSLAADPEAIIATISGSLVSEIGFIGSAIKTTDGNNPGKISFPVGWGTDQMNNNLDTSNFTIGLWVKNAFNKNSDYCEILKIYGQRSSEQVILDYDPGHGCFRFTVNDGEVYCGKFREEYTYENNSADWIYLAATYDETAQDANLYLFDSNGTQIETRYAAGSWTPNRTVNHLDLHTMYIGQSGYTENLIIDELSIQKCLNLSDIQTDVNAMVLGNRLEADKYEGVIFYAPYDSGLSAIRSGGTATAYAPGISGSSEATLASTTGYFGGAADFGYTCDAKGLRYLTSGNIDPNQGTIEFLWKPRLGAEIETQEVLFSAGVDSSHEIRITKAWGGPNGCYLRFRYRNGSTDILSQGLSGIYPGNSWQHIAASWDCDTGEFSLYMNGNRIDNDSVSSVIPLTSAQIGTYFYLGCFDPDVYSVNPYYCTGYIDELIIRNYTYLDGSVYVPSMTDLEATAAEKAAVDANYLDIIDLPDANDAENGRFMILMDSAGMILDGDFENVNSLKAYIDQCFDYGITDLVLRMTTSGNMAYESTLEQEDFFDYYDANDGIDVNGIFWSSDVLDTLISYGHSKGMRIHAWYTLFDEGYYPEADWVDAGDQYFDPNIEVGTWVGTIGEPCNPWGMYTVFAKENQKYLWEHRDGRRSGLALSYAFPDVRKYRIDLFKEAIAAGVDGLFLDMTRWGWHDGRYLGSSGDSIFDEYNYSLMGYEYPVRYAWGDPNIRATTYFLHHFDNINSWDINSANYNDYSAGDATVTINGSPNNVSGFLGRAIEITGSGPKDIEFDVSSADTCPEDEFTISCWVKSDWSSSAGYNKTIFKIQGPRTSEYAFIDYGNYHAGRFRFVVNDGEGHEHSEEMIYTSGSQDWLYVVVRYRASDNDFAYFIYDSDGKEVNNSTNVLSTSSGLNQLDWRTIKLGNYTTYNFNGIAIDEFNIQGWLSDEAIAIQVKWMVDCNSQLLSNDPCSIPANNDPSWALFRANGINELLRELRPIADANNIDIGVNVFFSNTLQRNLLDVDTWIDEELVNYIHPYSCSYDPPITLPSQWYDIAEDFVNQVQDTNVSVIPTIYCSMPTAVQSPVTIAVYNATKTGVCFYEDETIKQTTLEAVEDISRQVDDPNRRPGIVRSNYPPDGATNRGLTQDLSWAETYDADNYNIYFGTSYPPAYQTNQTSLIYDTGTMDVNTKYYWRIDANNTNGSTKGYEFDFTTGSGATSSIQFDAASSTSDPNGSSTLTWQHSIGDCYNQILIVAVTGESSVAANLEVESVTYRGVNMQRAAYAVAGSYPYNGAELWYMLDTDLPLCDCAEDIVVTFKGVVASKVGGAISIYNAKQQAPEAIATNTSANTSSISTDITTLTNKAWAIDIVGNGGEGTYTSTTEGMVERFDDNTGGYGGCSGAGSTKEVSVAGSTTMSWSSTHSSRTVHLIAVFALN